MPSVVTIYWQGGDPAGPNDAADPYNWVSGEPGHYLPAPGDLVVFAPNTGGLLDAEGEYIPAGVYNCEGFGGGPYGSITIPDAYTGQVTLGLSIDVGVFSMGGSAWGVQDPPEPGPGGVLDQNGFDVTVTQNFDWVNGTINVPGSEANLNLDGAIGEINPENGGVSTADTIRLLSASQVDFIQGAVTFTGSGAVSEDSIVIDGNSTFTCVSTTTTVAVQPWEYGPQYLTINSGTFNAAREGAGAGAARTINFSVRNLGGLFYVPVGTTVTITPPAVPVPFLPLLSYNQTTDLDHGARLEGGSTVNALGGFTVTSGSLWVKAIEADKVATIDGDFTMTGGAIQFDLLTAAAVGQLAVSGNVNWSGGQYNPGYNPVVAEEPGATGQCNLWQVGGTMTISGSAKLAGVKIGSEVPAPAGRWRVVTAGRITGQPENGTTSGMALGYVGAPVTAIQLYLP